MIHTIIGAGNIGTLMAAEFAHKGHEVRMYTRSASSCDKVLSVFKQNDEELYSAELALVTDKLADAVCGADVIWITYPSTQFASLSEKLIPKLSKGQALCVVPGACAEFFFKGCLEKECTLFGLQRVHSIARLKERGKSVYMLGRKSKLQVASIPRAQVEACRVLCEQLFELPTEALTTYLVETLTPSNPILHTTRLATMFSDWKPHTTYPKNILFYEEWSDTSSELLLACDAELQELCRVLEQELNCTLYQVEPLSEYYESKTPQAMTAKIASIQAFKGLGSPMKLEASGNWVPDFSSRYFTADFAYGLKAVVDIAHTVGCAVPKMESVLAWYAEKAGNDALVWELPLSKEELKALYAGAKESE